MKRMHTRPLGIEPLRVCTAISRVSVNNTMVLAIIDGAALQCVVKFTGPVVERTDWADARDTGYSTRQFVE